MTLKILVRFTLLCLLVAPWVSTASAQEHRHPRYSQILSDLRDARALLGPVRPSERGHERVEAAIHDIEEAIGEIKQAGFDDHKALDEHAPIDVHLTRVDRFHQARELLGSASRDLHADEDDPRARDLKNHAQAHVEEAWNIVKQLG